MISITTKALEGMGLDNDRMERCKNFTALGLTYWLFQRSKDHTLQWIETKFSKKGKMSEANQKALEAGWSFGEAGDVIKTAYRIESRLGKRAPGVYRQVSGNAAAALGLMAAANRAGLNLFLGSYPITPAILIHADADEISKILHRLSGRR